MHTTTGQPCEEHAKHLPLPTRIENGKTKGEEQRHRKIAAPTHPSGYFSFYGTAGQEEQRGQGQIHHAQATRVGDLGMAGRQAPRGGRQVCDRV